MNMTTRSGRLFRSISPAPSSQCPLANDDHSVSHDREVDMAPRPPKRRRNAMVDEEGKMLSVMVSTFTLLFLLSLMRTSPPCIYHIYLPHHHFRVYPGRWSCKTHYHPWCPIVKVILLRAPPPPSEGKGAEAEYILL